MRPNIKIKTKSLFLSLAIIVISNTFSFSQESYQVNIDRLTENFNKLKSFSDPNTKGNQRVAFSDYNVEALQWLKSKLTSMGHEVNIDYAGNLVAKRKGTDNTLHPIGFGSHIDCVPNGGHYDGQVGVLGGLEVLEYLEENNVQTKHPLEFIVFSNEEGVLLGSRALAGKLDVDALSVKNTTGYTNLEGIDRLGGNTDKVFDLKREKGYFHAFVELHIEQGGVLDEKGLDIGVVQGIVGIRWWDVTVTGFSNHAGTTPMNKRQDAMLAAAEFTLAVNEIVKSIPGTQVGTVGRIQAFPGVPNVIPGKVVLSLELRDLSDDTLDMLIEKIKKKSEEIGEQFGTTFLFAPISATAKPALTSNTVKDVIENESHDLGYTSLRMPSGAGHDTQDMALLGPVGMIFIPSKGGISHSPEEYSTFEQMATGTNVLLNTILSLDKIDEISD